jgi:hypothetical protein
MTPTMTIARAVTASKDQADKDKGLTKGSGRG